MDNLDSEKEKSQEELNQHEEIESSNEHTHGEKIRKLIKSIFKVDTVKRELSDVEKNILDKKIEEEEKVSKIDDVDFSRIQIDDVLEDRDTGRLIEFETFSPYLADYDLKNGIIWKDNLTNSDKIGLALAELFRELFPKGKLVSLYDEYNTNLPDTSDPRGIPTGDGPQIIVGDSTKETFKKGIVDLLRENGALPQTAEEGKDYFMISESSKQEDAIKLASQLKEKGMLDGDINQGELTFINPNAENPLFTKVTLRTKNGRWLCEALDASSFLDSINREYTHLIVLPNHFKMQQDKVWEILRALNIAKPDTYHNIFYDETADVNTVVQTIREEFAEFEKK